MKRMKMSESNALPGKAGRGTMHGHHGVTIRIDRVPE